jgi:hypothetical protein
VTDTGVDPQIHRRLAAELFNRVWALLEMSSRSREQDDEMVHAAHASRYHWGQVGEPKNLCIGEWQCSRVYATLGRAEPALHHAQRSLDICQEHGIGDFSLAYAYEALARAHRLAGNREEAARFLTLAREAGGAIADDEDRELLQADLATIERS